MNTDYLAENTLERLSPELRKRYSGCIAAADSLLGRYIVNFPTYTDHSLLHSLEVANLANYLISSHIPQLCAEELYILLMAALLHDVGMGFSAEEVAKRKPSGYSEYFEKNPDKSIQDFIRAYHHDLGAAFVLENWKDCFIPDEAMAAAIADVGRGHRKTDLMDRNLYPADLKLGGGTVNMAFLAAVIRLADELDVSAERNLMLQYSGFDMGDQTSVNEFQKHSLLSSAFSGDRFIVKGETNSTKEFDDLTAVCDGLQEMLDYCQGVVKDCTGTPLPVRVIQNEIKFIGSEVSLTIEADREGDTLTIALMGKLDTTTSALLEKKLVNNLNGGARNLVLDLRLLDYVSSAGLRIILSAKKKIMALTGDMKIINISPEVLEIFRLTGFDSIFNLDEDS